MKTTCRLVIDVVYDTDVTDPESLATATDRLLKTALSTPELLDDYGNPEFGEFYPIDEPTQDPSDPCRMIYEDGTVLTFDPADGSIVMFDELCNEVDCWVRGSPGYDEKRRLFAHLDKETHSG